jgi:hypothetical protein
VSPFTAALLEAVAVAVHLREMDMVGDAIQQYDGKAFGTEHLGPLLEG